MTARAEERWGSARDVPAHDGADSRFSSAQDHFTPSAVCADQTSENSTGNVLPRTASSQSSWSEPTPTPPPPAAPAQVSTCEVIILGAGVAGLAAAHHLLQRDRNLRLVVLEAADRVGGRVQSLPMKVRGGSVESFDFGPRCVSASQKHTMELLDDLNLAVYPQNHQGMKLAKFGEKAGISEYEESLPPVGSWWAYIQLQLFIWKLENLARQCSPWCPYQIRKIRQLDGYTVDKFTQQYVTNRAVLDFINCVCKIKWGCEARQLGLLCFLSDLHTADGFRSLLNSASDASGDQFCVKGGMQRICDRLVDHVGPECVQLRTTAVRVVQSSTSTAVITADGREFHCEYVICAVPPPLVTRIEFQPPLPPDKRLILTSMQTGRKIVCVVTYQQAFWREAGYSGDILSSSYYSSTEGIDSVPFCEVLDASTESGNPALMAILAGNAAVYWHQKLPLEREMAVVNSIALFFGETARSYIQYRDKIWCGQEWDGGWPCCYSTPGTMNFFPALRRSHGSVFFAGAESATQWAGTVSGASQSGQEIALEVLHRLRPECLSVADIQVINRRWVDQLSTSLLPVELELPSVHWGWKMVGATTAALLTLLVGRHCLRGLLTGKG